MIVRSMIRCLSQLYLRSTYLPYHLEFSTTSYSRKYCTSFLSLSENEYEDRSEKMLSKLHDYMDALPELVNTDPMFDVSYSMGVLTITVSPVHGIYVINKQTPNRQIWLSSPISGPKRYDLSSTGKWIYKHDGISLNELLENEFRSIFKTEQINLDNL